MHEHLWSQWYLLLLGQAHCGRKKVLFFSRSLITRHKFNNHSSISIFLTAWLFKLTRDQCTCCHFITIAYNLIPRVLSPDEVVLLTLYVCPRSWLGFCFWKPRRVFRLPTSNFRLLISEQSKKCFFPLLLGRLCSRRFFLSRLFHIRAVYTRENMPRLTIAVAYIRRESNTPYKWYKIYAHGLFNPRPAQAAAYPGRGVLGWAYPSRGLPWTWKC